MSWLWAAVAVYGAYVLGVLGAGLAWAVMHPERLRPGSPLARRLGSR